MKEHVLLEALLKIRDWPQSLESEWEDIVLEIETIASKAIEEYYRD